MITSLLSILFLAFAQNVSFTIVSRSRNRSSFTYHMIAAVFSNSIFFLTFRELILAEMSWLLFIPYLIGTVAGSLTGAKVSMWIEKKVNAQSDDHLGPQWSPPQFSSPMAKVEVPPAFPVSLIHIEPKIRGMFWPVKEKAAMTSEIIDDTKTLWAYASFYLSETYTGPFDSREEAIREALAAYPDRDSIVIGKAVYPDPGEIAAKCFDVEDLEERMEEYADTHGWMNCDDALFEATPGRNHREATVELEDALRVWAEKYLKAQYFTVKDVEVVERKRTL